MTYVLYNPDHTIKTFMEYIADVPLAPGETFALSSLSFEEYAAQFVLSCEGQSCCTVYTQVGAPAVVIDVSAPGLSSVDVAVNGQAQTVSLTNGKGSFTLDTSTPQEYRIEPADCTRFCPAGASSLAVIIPKQTDGS